MLTFLIRHAFWSSGFVFHIWCQVLLYMLLSIYSGNIQSRQQEEKKPLYLICLIVLIFFPLRLVEVIYWDRWSAGVGGLVACEVFSLWAPSCGPGVLTAEHCLVSNSAETAALHMGWEIIQWEEDCQNLAFRIEISFCECITNKRELKDEKLLLHRKIILFQFKPWFSKLSWKETCSWGHFIYFSLSLWLLYCCPSRQYLNAFYIEIDSNFEVPSELCNLWHIFL